MKKIAVACMYTENIKDMGKIAEENRKIYCRKHNYIWRCLYKTLDPSRHPVWSKILWLIQLIQEKKYDWIQWTDADSIVANMSIKIEHLIMLAPFSNVIVSKDWWTGLNAGQFLIRSCEWSERFLNRVYYGHPSCLTHLFNEQEAMRLEICRVESMSEKRYIAWIDKSKINSYIHPGFGHQYIPGDFIIHFAGLNPTRRLRYMKIFQEETYQRRYHYMNIGLQTLAFFIALVILYFAPSAPVKLISVFPIIIIIYLILLIVIYII